MQRPNSATPERRNTPVFPRKYNSYPLPFPRTPNLSPGYILLKIRTPHVGSVDHPERISISIFSGKIIGIQASHHLKCFISEKR